MSAKNRFFWHDLMVKDVEKAKAFYGELFGWSFKTDDGPEPYTHVMAGGTGVGGIMKLDEKMGAPACWVGYISVDNVDAVVSASTKRGGTVVVPKQVIPEVGDFAFIADAQGAVVAPMVYRGKDAGKPENLSRPKPGEFCWDELYTSDPAAASKFYADVYGWGQAAMEMPGWGTYHLLTRPGMKDDKGMDRNAGGITKLQGGAGHPYWLSYVAVADCDASKARAEKLGAKTVVSPMDIPNVGRFAVFFDPQQVAFAILAPPK